MKRFAFTNHTVIILWFVLSVLCLSLGYLLKQPAKNIFQLSFEPLNVETNANVNLEENSITFEDIQQSLTISNLPQGILKVSLTFTGGVMLDEVDLALPALLFVINQQSISIEIHELVHRYDHHWVQLQRGDFTIHLQNFVKIEEQMYSLILSDISIIQLS